MNVMRGAPPVVGGWCQLFDFSTFRLFDLLGSWEVSGVVRAGVMNRNDKAASAQEEAEGAVESFLLPRGKEKKGGGGFSRDMRVMGSPAAGCERAAGESEYRVGGVQGLVLWFGGVRAHRRWGV